MIVSKIIKEIKQPPTPPYLVYAFLNTIIEYFKSVYPKQEIFNLVW